MASCPAHLDRTARIRRLALCCTILAAGFWIPRAAAKDAPGFILTVGEPEGFANLTDSQVLVVDVYFGGLRKGEAQIKSSPGTVSLIDAASIVALLPEVSDRAAVEAVLSAGDLSSNASLACGKTSDPSRCGRLEPEVAGVIFDRERFRLDIFVNPRFLDVENGGGDIYLPTPEDGVALINSVAAVVSGQSGAAATYYNFQNSLVIGDGERRLRADLTYASKLGFGAERLAFEWDRPELRYTAGAMWARGSEIVGRRKVIGAGVESQIDTRLDKDEILGSPVVVYLDRRARVDIVRDGRVLHSAIYEAGNQQIDTSRLPDGSYAIVLRIEEPGSPARVEPRFYTKSHRIPSLGRTDFYAIAGFLVDDIDRGSLEPSRHPYFQGGVSRRIGENWAIGGNVEASDEGASAEVGVTLLTRVAQVRAAAVADLDGTYGGIVQIGSSGSSRLNFNFDLRHIEGDGRDPLPNPTADGSLASPFLGGFSGRYSQVGGVLSYSFANVRFLGTFFYRDDESQAARYSIGPSLEWDVLRKGRFLLTLRGDMTATERGEAGFAGIALRLLGGRTSLTAHGGARTSTMPDDAIGEGPVAALSAAWSPAVAGGELALGAGFEHQPNQDNAVLSADFRHPLGSLAGDLVRSEGPLSATTLYSLGFQTTVAAGAGALQVAGRTSTESMIVARVKGARVNDNFDILINEQVAGTVSGSSPLTLSLPAYRAYEVRIRPTGADLVAYDSSPRSVGLYPGSVAKLDWTVSPVTIKFGRLRGPDGKPLARATLTGKGIWAETDDQGYFQIEASDDAELTITTQDRETFTMTLPPGEPNAGIARLGEVPCCEGDTIKLGALDPFAQPAIGETQ